jgi:hypothetical protein
LQCPRCHGVSSTSLPETAPLWPLVLIPMETTT